MKIAIRAIPALFTFVATYCFVYWLPLSLIPNVHEIYLLPHIISFLIATVLSILVWNKMSTTSGSLASHIMMGGVIFGAIGFILGFFGPVIFSPGSSQEPLTGILITGPSGFIVGLICGAIYWKSRRKNL